MGWVDLLQRRSTLLFASCFRAVHLAVIGMVVSTTVASAADLTVNVSGVQGTNNAVRVALYSNPDTFRHEAQAKQIVSVPAHDGTVTAVFHDLQPGPYAVVAYHDENGNGKLDLMLGMFPDEGWGLSNDPTVIGPPAFDDSAFEIVDPSTTITVPLHY